MKKISLRKLSVIGLIVLDIVVAVLACYCGLVIFGSSFTVEHYQNLLYFAIAYPILSVVLFHVFRLYNSMWSYASVHEFTCTFLASFILFVVNFFVCLFGRLHLLIANIIVAECLL